MKKNAPGFYEGLFLMGADESTKKTSCVSALMSIKSLAKLTLLGLAYIYAAKMVDTLHHGIFRHIAVASTVVGLNIFAGLAQLAFFVVMHRQFVTRNKPVIKLGSRLAIMGSAIGMVPKFLAIAFLFQSPSLFFFVQHGPQIGAFCPWLSAMFMGAFCLLFLLDDGFKDERFFKRAFVAGAIGWFVMAAVQSFVIINYLTDGRQMWLRDLFAAGPIALVVFSTLTFICLSIFYLTFATTDEPL